MADLLSASDAARRIVAGVTPLEPVQVPISEALHRVLAEPVIAPLDIPPWDNSAMDGYAVDSRTLAGQAPPVELTVVDYVPAGGRSTRRPGAGEATRIFTGAPLPPGTDSVIRQEDTEAIGPDRVRVHDLRDLNRNTRLRGEDIRRGETVFPAGHELSAASIGVLASLAQDRALVHRAPRVAVLCSGDEIADIDERDAILAGAKIASSNTYTMTALTGQAGGIPVPHGIARDDPADLEARLRRAAECDLVVTSAGVSVGEHDHVRAVLEKMGTDMKFWRLRMRPGAPVGYGMVLGKPWIGLPGNPVSTMVTFELFVRPAIRRMLGHARPYRRTRPVTVDEPIRLGPRLRHFLRVTLDQTGAGLPLARLTGPQGSGILKSMALAQALLIVPEDRPVVDRGEVLEALILDDPVHSADPGW